jgi:hypothetical protein
MKSFAEWFGDSGRPVLVTGADEDDLPDGLYMAAGQLRATCRVCDKEYDYDGDADQFDKDMSYCGGSPSCCP